ncbi:competence type IV pilus minor pilin ComGF [Anaerobacillus sp. MEB173]|uniref:competence type IV pilus minor pilin ComGF n=1 Tax=Anaerobacillus sp. MEB173 TaxID=3383345 RepID=UPI003F9204A9
MIGNQRGFTLIEAVIALSIFLVVVSLFPLFVSALQHQEKKVHILEVSLFFNQLAMEVRETSRITTANGTLFLQIRGQEVSYSRHGARIRRQVNGGGQEIVLQHVASVDFKLISNGVNIFIADTDGGVFSRRLSMIYGRNYE